jgi:hypothetical protein
LGLLENQVAEYVRAMKCIGFEQRTIFISSGRSPAYEVDCPDSDHDHRVFLLIQKIISRI